jgi:single-stranded DNA-binding protein
MRGIEAATWGIATRDGEVRQLKAGNDFGIVNIAMSEGKTDDAGKEVSTYLKILLFSGLAHDATNIKKGDRVYCEGSLGAEVWTGAIDGKPRLDLSIRASKFERAQIGKAAPATREQPRDPRVILRRSRTAGKPRIQGRDEFGDAIPF